MKRQRRDARPTVNCCLTVAALLLTACATTQALFEAPEEFWWTVEKLLIAIWQDVESTLLLLGI